MSDRPSKPAESAASNPSETSEAPTGNLPNPELLDSSIRVESPYAGTRIPSWRHLAIAAFWFGSNFQWGALLAVVLPSQVGRIVPAQKAEMLGLIGGLAAIVALIVPLISGPLSDRCASRFGRRRPYIVVGGAINLLGLALMYFAAERRSLELFVGAYCLVQLGNNIATGPYSGLIPDLVPMDQRGVASGHMAMMSLLGSLLGALVSGQLIAQHSALAYMAIGAAMTGFLIWTVAGIREAPLPSAPPRLKLGQHLKSLWIDPRHHPDFAWVWITRALVMLGFYSVQPFLQYYLADVLGVPEPEKTAGIVLAIVLVFATASSYAGGVISDKVGRKRVVYVANGVIAAMTLALIVCRSLEQAIAVGIVFGVGYGAYISVDWALGTDVLPSRLSAAKDMAVWHISMVLPQSLAQPFAGKLLSSFGVREATDPTTGAALTHYSPTGYLALFSLAATFFVVAAVLLRNVKKAR